MVGPRPKLFQLSGMDTSSLKLFAEVAFSLACWYLILCCVPEFALVLAGLVSASGPCLGKVCDDACKLASNIMTVIENRRAVNSGALEVQNAGIIMLLNILINDAGPKVLTAKQRRLGVHC